MPWGSYIAVSTLKPHSALPGRHPEPTLHVNRNPLEPEPLPEAQGGEGTPRGSQVSGA